MIRETNANIALRDLWVDIVETSEGVRMRESESPNEYVESISYALLERVGEVRVHNVQLASCLPFLRAALQKGCRMRFYSATSLVGHHLDPLLRDAQEMGESVYLHLPYSYPTPHFNHALPPVFYNAPLLYLDVTTSTGIQNADSLERFLSELWLIASLFPEHIRQTRGTWTYDVRGNPAFILLYVEGVGGRTLSYSRSVALGCDFPVTLSACPVGAAEPHDLQLAYKESADEPERILRVDLKLGFSVAKILGALPTLPLKIG